MEAIFPKAVKFEDLVKTCFMPEMILKYEQNTEEAYNIPLSEDCRSAGFNYSRIKKVYTIESRETYDKGFMFFDDGKFYRYLSNVPNSVGEPEYEGDMSKRPVHSNATVRGETLFSVITIERDDKGKLLVTMLLQLDTKLNLPGFIVTTFMPSAMKTWYKNVSKFVANKKNFQ